MNGTIIKQKMLAHLEMTRPYTLFHAGLLAVAGAEVASQGHAVVWRVVLAALTTLCGWEAGLYAGDYFDRNLDALSKPMRAIPSGRVSPGEARNVMIVLILLGYAAALALGIPNLILALGTTALGIAYSQTLKNHALFGNFDRGILGICAVAFGAAANPISAWFPLILLAVMVCCHDASTNLVGAMRDKEGDEAAGYKTAPVVYGMGRSADIACGLALVSITCGTISLLLAGPGVLTILLLLLTFLLDLIVYVPLGLTRKRVTRQQALSAHKWLVFERLTLMSAFIALYIPLGVVLLLYLGTLAATAISQQFLRDRYERSAAKLTAKTELETGQSLAQPS